MKKLLVSSLLLVSSIASASQGSEVLDCAYSYRAFGRNMGIYVNSEWDSSLTQMKNQSYRGYFMTASHLGTARTAVLVLDSGIYKIEYSQSDVQGAIDRKSDYVDLKVTGVPEGDVYASIMDETAFRFIRRFMNYGFGSSIYWGFSHDTTYSEIKAVPMNAEETKTFLSVFSKTINSQIQGTQKNLTHKLEEVIRRKEHIEKSIPEREKSIATANRERSELEFTSGAKQAEINKFAAKTAGQTDEDILEALNSKIGQLEGEKYKMTSRIFDLKKDIQQNEEWLASYKKSQVTAESDLKKESEATKPVVELFQSEVIGRCAPVTSIK